MTQTTREAILMEALQELKRVPVPTADWPEQRRADFRLGAFACLNVLHRMLGMPIVSPDHLQGSFY